MVLASAILAQGGNHSSRLSVHEIATDLENIFDFVPKDDSSFELMEWVQIAFSEEFQS